MTPDYCWRSVGITCLALLAALASGGQTATGEEPSSWSYVTPNSSDRFPLPPARMVKLSIDRLESLHEPANYRGSERRYGSIVFGTPNSMPVTMVLDKVSEAEVDLYVDLNRNQSLDAKERTTISLGADGQGGPIRLPLGADTLKDEVVTTEPREVQLWVGRAGKSLRYATVGYLDGSVELVGRRVACRRVDGNGDGFVTGADDLLWMDLNGDGEWNPFSERFSPAPILRLEGTRYSLRSTGNQGGVSLAEVHGTGTLVFSGEGIKTPAAVSEIQVSIIGRDGTGATIRSLGGRVDVPVGEYQVYRVEMVLQAPADRQQWYYQFASNVSPDPEHWHAVKVGGVTSVAPLASLQFQGKLSEPLAERSKPDTMLTVRTRLTAGDGMYLRICCRDRVWNNFRSSMATVALKDSSGSVLSSAQSGFN